VLSGAGECWRVWSRSVHRRAAAIDIHEIALALYTAMVANADPSAGSDASRAALGREAYRCAEAFIAAKDTYIREQPVPNLEPTGY